MNTCYFCNTPLSEDAVFCGSCGHTVESHSQHLPTQQISTPGYLLASSDDEIALASNPSKPPTTATNGSSNDNLYYKESQEEKTFVSLDHDFNQETFISRPNDLDAETFISHPGIVETVINPPVMPLAPIQEEIAGEPTVALTLDEEDEDDEEKKKKKKQAMLLGLGLGVAGVAGLEMNPLGQAASAPEPGLAQAVPETGSPNNSLNPNPVTPAPQIPANFLPPVQFPDPSNLVPTLQNGAQNIGGFQNASSFPNPPSPKPKPPANGCAPWLIIIMLPIILIGTVYGLGITLFAPQLGSISGLSTVSHGGVLALHGSNFLPGASITLTFDNDQPFNLLQTALQSQQAAYQQQQSLAISRSYSSSLAQITANNIVKANSSGSFDANAQLSENLTGKHIAYASEAGTFRRAGFNFNVEGSTPTPTPTSTTTPTQTPTPSQTPTTTPQALALANLDPSILAINPTSGAMASSIVTLKTTGTGNIDWTATPHVDWLSVTPANGTIIAPADQQVTVVADLAKLAQGSNTSTITFQSGETKIELPVTVNVPQGCFTATSYTMKFNAVANVSQPDSQTLQIQNCGLLGTGWNATSNQDWLNIDPTSGNLNSNTNSKVKVSVVTATMKAGTYNGQITFNGGGKQFVVSVTLTVAEGPQIAGRPADGSIIYVSGCASSTDQRMKVYHCSVDILNQGQYNAPWSSSFDKGTLPNVTYGPTSGTLPTGSSPTTITVDVPASSCLNDLGAPMSNSGSLHITGPANSLTFTFQCWQPIG